MKKSNRLLMLIAVWALGADASHAQNLPTDPSVFKESGFRDPRGHRWVFSNNPNASWMNKPPGHLGLTVQIKDTDDNIELRKQVAERLRTANLVPPARTVHFRWLGDAWNARIDGWNGLIQEVQTTPRGWIVTVKIFPRITVPRNKAPIVMDYVLERYEMANGRLTLLNFTGSPNRHPSTIIIL